MKTKAKSKFEDMIELSKSRKEMYYFLTVAFTYQTLKEISRMVKDKSILASLPSEGEGFKLLRNYVEKASKQKVESTQDELEIEHTGLFVLPNKKFRPYESAYITVDDGLKLMGGPITKEVEKVYKGMGVEFTSALDETADYIGIEFEFLHLLCAKEEEAWSKGEGEDAFKILLLEREFLQGHVARWVFDFCDDLYKKAKLDFFKAIAIITKEYVDLEKSEINEIIAKAEKAG